MISDKVKSAFSGDTRKRVADLESVIEHYEKLSGELQTNFLSLIDEETRELMKEPSFAVAMTNFVLVNLRKIDEDLYRYRGELQALRYCLGRDAVQAKED